MPFGSVTLIPGVNVERTPTLLKTGVAQSQLVRYKDDLVQKLGGWTKFYPFALSGVPRDLHAWQDLNTTDHLAVGTTNQVVVITNNNIQDITPQTLISDFTPNFTTVMNSTTVEVTDANISDVTIYDSIVLNTPISVGGIILSGAYPIVLSVSTHAYNITAATPAVSSVNNGGAVPQFTTVSGSSIVSVLLAAHGLSQGNTTVFPITTTGNGVTVQGSYTVASVTDVDNFTITVVTQATSSGAFNMNGGNAEIEYFINIGPPAAGAGYGTGAYGSGGYGTGTIPGQQVGIPITATDYTSDNWGRILLFCPSGGGVYQYDPTGGFLNGGLVSSAPVFNGGIFVSTTEQILVCWGSTVQQDIGIQQDPLFVKWSTVGDFTNFQVLVTDQAGGFRIPTGSKIMGGMATPSQNLIWTDIDCWAMNYQGLPFVFGFNNIGSGAGLISSHAQQRLRGNVYWMGQANFYSYTGNGVSVMSCPVWDFVFQNLNTAFQQNVRAMPNTPFNEAGWAFPSLASTNGECDSYVKVNITEQGLPWDYGSLARSAWTDQSVLGNPIGTVPTGVIYQHETSNDADGQPLAASFTTGYFYIAEGEDFAFIDQILPDFKWGFYGAAQTAQIQLTFYVVNFPGDTPTAYGPYTVTQSTEALSVRFRGRQMAVGVQSSDVGSFWRLGRLRYRYAPSGRR